MLPEDGIPFPSLTVCSFNYVRKSYVESELCNFKSLLLKYLTRVPPHHFFLMRVKAQAENRFYTIPLSCKKIQNMIGTLVSVAKLLEQNTLQRKRFF